MNIKEYITSGIVELYAMKSLTQEEMKEFERLMVLYPEIASELRKVEKSLEDYTIVHSVNPRPVLREQIMADIREVDKVVHSKTKLSPNPDSNHQALTYKYLVAASLAALVISTFASWFFYTRWNEVEERYSDILNEKNDLAQNYNYVKTSFEEAVSYLDLIRDKHSTIVNLNATDTSLHYQVRVYWNKYTRRTYLDALLLPSPGEGKQFQLWAIAGGTAVDAGVFISDSQEIQRLKDVTGADSWLVTLEPKGGSTEPTPGETYLTSKGS